MGRYEQWDIISGVGITALAVAAGRAIETGRDDALVDDPYAHAFVRAADTPTAMPTEPVGDDAPDSEKLWEQAANHMGVRSRYFDDYFRQACAEGIRQVVILAAGLDTRAFRLDWPAGMRVFELDQPRVLDFKNDVLTGNGAEAACERQVVPADLREEWSTLLRKAGFDPNVPTAWLAEGLLPYLSQEAKDSLLNTVGELSAPGSRMAIEHAVRPQRIMDDPTVKTMSEQFGIDFAALMPEPTQEDQLPPEEWLDPDRWVVASESAASVADRYGRSADLLTELIPDEDFRFVTAYTSS